ncbi:signal recognition particle-docking protein FtsY [Buchnera aphidicola (Aphis helianthi)]|uniref:Signal recognition particle receptor FtsY n=1 Tax=Buchnera aphidicola (Aphis helianthi) TaxID=2315802 RepID=A0A4D6XQS4_9GAMM|nr:signal recognition particle-docking protein FtsY [Buchnera aphidicola]QCI16870.1 signal recognition particle-docking protein FtsY [Buchnera aphidicola (Aphis helianthi)]
MNDNKKNNLFSWINSKIIKKNKIDLNKHERDKQISTKDSIKTNDKNNTKINFFFKLKESLKKTKNFFGNSISRIFSIKHIDNDLFEELEDTMILSDIGITTTEKIIQGLIKDTSRKELKNPKSVYFLLKERMHIILKKVEVPLLISNKMPFVILIVGVNGTGKTTTALKLAKKYKLDGKSVMLAAADTFRAAAIDQLQTLGKIHNIPVIAQVLGTDPAAVAFDALKSAISKKVDVLIIDTAGRLHNKQYLLEELKKIIRVVKKLNVSAPHEIILVIDACNGQNTIKQTEIFHKELNLTGLIITKLDGTAKGGVIFALSDQFSIPIRYIGTGEKSTDLVTFNSNDFINSIFHSIK